MEAVYGGRFKVDLSTPTSKIPGLNIFAVVLAVLVKKMLSLAPVTRNART